VQSAGQLNLNDFVLTMAAGLQLNGGNLSGSGSIVGNVTNNGATLQPGGAAAIGTINITGDLINTSGVIEIEIQSVATPGITHDLIAVSGQTDLNDTLTLLPFGGYTVSDNDSVTPITSTTSINNFSVINPIGIETVIPTYNAAGLDLLFTLGGVIGWDGEAADGNWFSVTNWIGDVLPTINDDVAIGVFNVTIAGAADANTLTLASGGSLTLTSGSLTIANDSTLTGDLIVAGGTLNLTNALTINSNLDWTSVANSTIDGGTTGSLIVNGTLNITGNNFHSFSGITVNNFGVTSYLATGGTTALRLNDGTTFNNNGLFDIQDNLLVGNLAGVAAFNNQAGGELRKSGGTAAATIVAGIAYTNSSASISIQSGSLTVNGGASLTLDSASVLEGSGTYIGDLVNNGTIRPGGALTTGTLSVNGVFTNTGAIEIEIDSIAGGPGVGYDELAIIGGNLANLGGNLDLISINGYRVLNGDALTPVSYGSRSGTFTVTAIGSEIISPTYNAGALDLVLNLGGLFSFTGGGDGSTWNDAANWNQGLPGIVNDVSIGNFNVTIADNASANTLSLASTGSLNLSGGTLTIASNSTLEGPVTMSGGDLDIGGATLTLNGGFNWTGPGFIFGGGSGILNLPAANIIAGAGRQGVDAVIVNISGNTTYSTGSLELYNGGGDPIINNSGIFDFTGDVSIANFTDGGSPGFNNLDGGTILKSAGTGTSTIDLMPGNSNQGNVTLQSGTLDIGLASWTLGVGDVFSGSGTYVGDVVNNGGVIRPGGQGNVGTLTVIGDYTNSLGTLEVEIDGPTTHDVLAVSNSLGYGGVAGSILDISLLAFIPSVGESHGVISCSGFCDVATPFGSVNQPGGVTHAVVPFAGPGGNLNLTVTSVSFFWDAGGPTDNWFDALNWSLDVLPNIGTDVVLASGNNVIFDDSLAVMPSIASLTMNSGSTLNLANGTLTNAGLLTINNGAAFNVSGGNLINTGIATIAGSYSQSSGSANFNNAVTISGGFNLSGNISTLANFNNTVTVSGGFTQSGGISSFNGVTAFPGTFNLNSGVANFNAAATLQNLNNTWSGGTISGGTGQSLVLGVSPGDTTLAIVGGATKTLDTITLDMNLNDINMSGNGSLLLANNATIDNTGGRSFNHSGSGSIAGVGRFINNGGSFNKSAGLATLSVDLINDASSLVNVAGGTLIIDDAEANDNANYNVGNAGVLIFAQDRSLGGNLNLDGSVIAGLGTTPTTVILPTNLNNNGALLLNNAVLDLSNMAGNTLVMNNGTLLGGSGTVQGNVNNVAGVVTVGGTETLGNLVITGSYTQGADSAVVVDVLNNGVDTISDLLTVNGSTQLNGGTLLIGFVTSSLGLVTGDFQPFSFSGGASGKFTRVFDAGGNILLINFNGGVFTILGASPDVPDRVIDDMISFLEGSDELNETVASNRSSAEAVMDELLEEEEQGSLVCN